ncbi:MAG TPA: hypothetical protein PKC21_08190 [Oligoflexia bacterium]|nr:hypothetical protein [Oligoflexia bacterium]HMR25318.1 hypothetical protein [Oligoflexia bacterium]
MMMETLKKTTTVVVLLISSQIMAQGIYGDDIPYPKPGPALTEEQTIVSEIGTVDNQLMPYFYSPVADVDGGCTITAEKNNKPYYSLVFSNCEGISGELASVPVSGWNNEVIPEQEQRELVTKRKFSKQVYKRLDQDSCGNYDQCSQTIQYTLLFSDYRALSRASGAVDELYYQLNVDIKVTENFWDVITDEPVIGNLPRQQSGPSSVETINLVLNY